MLRSFDFLKSTRILDRNLILFRDNEQANYQRGLSADIPSMAAFLDWQASQLALHFPHVRSTYCLGTSAGAYAAIVSGYFLKVPIVWSFGPMTLIDEPYRPSESDPISRRCFDLGELLRDGNGVTEYRIFYNNGYKPDVVAAERLKNCPGVRLFPQPGDDHGVVYTMADLGSLADVLVPFEGI